MSRLLQTQLPLVAAPMAGGPTTIALAAATARAGAFPFLAAGYTSSEAMAAQVDEARRLRLPFGVNLFVPSTGTVDEEAFVAYARELAPEAAAHGLQLDPAPMTDDDDWSAKLAYLTEHPVPVVSLTFGLPAADAIEALQHAGSLVLSTVTTPEEAFAAHRLGVDGLIAQGTDAGGHSAVHDATRASAPLATETLLREARRAVDLPVIATGGIDGPAAVRRLLHAGADAVAVGTLLLRTDEAGTSATHRRALADPRFGETVVTRAFTGRPARALKNAFVERHDATAPPAYPAVHHLTRPLRQAAARAGDADRLHLWAGTGYGSAPEGPAADAIRWLAGVA